MKKISILCVLVLAGIVNVCAQTKNQNKQFTESLMQDACMFETTGRNQYFILEPGYQLVLEGKESKLVITVLNETRKIGGAKAINTSASTPVYQIVRRIRTESSIAL